MRALRVAQAVRASVMVAMTLTLGVLSGMAAVPAHAAAEPALLLAQANQQGSPLELQNRNLEESEARRRARIRTELAITYFQDGRYSIALDELKQALTLDPNYAEAIGILALVYMELGEKPLAEQNFRRALQLKPNDSDINVNYGWYLCSTGREKESISYFLNAVKNPLYERPSIAWQNAGICALRLNDLPAAESYLRRSYEIDPDGVVASVGLARVYYARGEYERARFLVSAVNRSPAANAESMWLGLRVERKLGNNVESSGLAQRLQRAFPNSKEAGLVARGAFDE